MSQTSAPEVTEFVTDFAEPPPLDVDALSFLLPVDADLVYDLHVVHNQLRVVIGLNPLRNGFMVEFQERLARIEDQSITVREAVALLVANVFGQRFAHMCIAGTYFFRADLVDRSIAIERESRQSYKVGAKEQTP